jgi:uncharacterized membrane protein
MYFAVPLVLLTFAVVTWLSRQKARWVRRLLDWFPAILFAYLVPAIFTHALGLDLSKVVLHQWSKEWIIPLAILSVMSALSFGQLHIIGVRPIILFVAGSFIIAVLPILLLTLSLPFTDALREMLIVDEYWKGLVPIVGSWIGGSTSQLVLKELISCPEPLFLAILVLDNVLVNLWTIFMFQMIKRSDRLNRYFSINDPVPDFVANEVEANARHNCITIIVLTLVTVSAFFLIPSFLWKIVALSVGGLLLGNLIPNWSHALALKLASISIVFIMTILGLKLNFHGFGLPPLLVGLVAVWMILHLVFMVFVARLLRLHMAWVPIASMANLGGISTAPAVTAAYNEEWMPHAVVLAILSMVSGTAWGAVTIFLFGLF